MCVKSIWRNCRETAPTAQRVETLGCRLKGLLGIEAYLPKSKHQDKSEMKEQGEGVRIRKQDVR